MRDITIDPTWSVNQLMARVPASMQLLNTCGIDTCCGGELSLGDAARDANMALDDLLRLLGSMEEAPR